MNVTVLFIATLVVLVYLCSNTHVPLGGSKGESRRITGFSFLCFTPAAAPGTFPPPPSTFWLHASPATTTTTTPSSPATSSRSPKDIFCHRLDKRAQNKEGRRPGNWCFKASRYPKHARRAKRHEQGQAAVSQEVRYSHVTPG